MVAEFDALREAEAAAPKRPKAEDVGLLGAAPRLVSTSRRPPADLLMALLRQEALPAIASAAKRTTEVTNRTGTGLTASGGDFRRCPR
ncbi:hypothetical protein SAMN05421854_11586 [Amycolatopsis rubida]|uniref:Uncharacterized protein n=1 Tax=Amycolatopsis rubida TaxID=112413 RepID=A0A1I5ZIE6_9PSEU|nr:hypothetical protein SAMN05421854_11586 [Amycolatopsis rubida]